MVPNEKVKSFLQAVRELYFLPDPRRAAMESQSLFVSKPGGGAAILFEEWAPASSAHAAIIWFKMDGDGKENMYLNLGQKRFFIDDGSVFDYRVRTWVTVYYFFV